MKVFASLVVVVAAATVLLRAQQPPAILNTAPTISSFDTPYGGAGPNSASTFTISGSAFSTVPHQTRFIDPNGNDVFQGVSCSSTTSCTASVRPGLMPALSSGNIAVRAFTQAGGPSAGSINFYYYGPPSTVLTPDNGPYDANTPYTISGGRFTTGFAPSQGTTSVHLFLSIFDGTCGSTTSCSQTAPSLLGDCCEPQGVHRVDIRTPGGNDGPLFSYGNSPFIPTITSVSPNTGPSSGGNTITILGNDFIAGTNSSGFPFGVTLGTSFTFVTSSNSLLGSSVNCPSTTMCTVVAPNGPPGALADIQVQTVCGINSSAGGCGGTNPAVDEPGHDADGGLSLCRDDDESCPGSVRRPAVSLHVRERRQHQLHRGAGLAADGAGARQPGAEHDRTGDRLARQRL